MEEIDIRKPFVERIAEVSEDTISYYDEIKKHLLSFKKVKCRESIRCDSFRIGRKLVAKIALGGKTLKLYLAIPIDAEILVNGKYHEKDVSKTVAYKEVPTLFIIKSSLAAKKVCDVIDYMMRHNI